MSDPIFSRRHLWLWAILSVAAVVVVVFMLPGDLFLSSSAADLGQLASSRAFAADSIQAGHFPLWNPYQYSGQPMVGDFQAAELYPLNAFFLFLPLARAMNLSFLLHLLILGWGVGYWVSRRGCHPLAAALAGVVMVLSGPVFPRLYAGHVANVCTMAWAPWMLLALEAAWRGPVWRPLLLAAAAVALQILGGHPQYVFYVAIAAGLHAVVQSVVDPAVRRRALPMVAAAYLGGAALAAAQLAPGFAAAAESVRHGQLGYSFVRSFSFPPENLLTLIAPGFFGDLTAHPYWGRCYPWEVIPFVGVAGLALAALAAVGREHGRRARCDLLVAALLLLLALGNNTPLLPFLYDYAPGFDKFRGLAKFIFPMALFIAPAIGAGADMLIRGRFGPKIFAALLSAMGALAFGAGLFIWVRPASIAGLMAALQRRLDSYVAAAQVADAQFIHDAGVQAGHSLVIGGVLLAVVGLAILLARWRPPWRWVPLGLLPVEMLCFASANLATTRLADLTPPRVREFIAAHAGDYRVLTPAQADDSYFLGAANLWGNDPAVLLRYAEFIQFAEGGNPEGAGQYVQFKVVPRAFDLVRFGAAFVPNPAQPDTFQIIYNPHPLPHALLVSNYQVLPGRDAILAALLKADFYPAQTVYLETEPSPRPQSDAPAGTVQVSDVTSDSLTIEADTPAPTLLLLTDLYSRDWHARALPGSGQAHYDILPADYIVRAIPLQAGHHHLVVEYAPPSFRKGLLISGLAWLVWVGTLGWDCRRGGRRLCQSYP
jgi:hypothetical protein